MTETIKLIRPGNIPSRIRLFFLTYCDINNEVILNQIWADASSEAGNTRLIDFIIFT